MNDGPEGPYYPGQTIKKDPNADLPYDFDWSEWLGDTAQIASADVEVAPDVVEASSTIVGGTVVRVRLTGGTVRSATYSIRCRVTTNETPPRIDDRTIHVRVVER